MSQPNAPSEERVTEVHLRLGKSPQYLKKSQSPAQTIRSVKEANHEKHHPLFLDELSEKLENPGSPFFFLIPIHIFLIAATDVWCRIYEPDLVRTITCYVYSPSMFVIGILCLLDAWSQCDDRQILRQFRNMWPHGWTAFFVVILHKAVVKMVLPYMYELGYFY